MNKQTTSQSVAEVEVEVEVASHHQQQRQMDAGVHDGKVSLEALLDFTPTTRVAMKQATQACRDERSALWRLKESLGSLAATMEQLGADIDNVQNKFRDVTSRGSGHLQHDYQETVDWMATFAGCAKESSRILSSVVIGELEEAMGKIQNNILKPAESCMSLEKDLCNALAQYGRLVEGKATEKACFEENARVYEARKAYHGALLEQCCRLNVFDVERKTIAHGVLCKFLQVFMQFSSHGLSRQAFKTMSRSLNDGIAATAEAKSKLTTSQNQLVSHILDHCDPQYFPEIDPNNPFIDDEQTFLHRTPALLSETPWEYIFFKSKVGKLNPSRVLKKTGWVVLYCGVVGHALECRDLDNNIVETLPLSRASCSLDDVDNRRHIFSVKPWKSKRRYFFQARSSQSRHAWVTKLDEISKLAPPDASQASRRSGSIGRRWSDGSDHSQQSIHSQSHNTHSHTQHARLHRHSNDDEGQDDAQEDQAQMLPGRQDVSSTSSAPLPSHLSSLVVTYSNQGSTDLRHEPLSDEESDPDDAEWFSSENGCRLVLKPSETALSHVNALDELYNTPVPDPAEQMDTSQLFEHRPQRENPFSDA